jgi:hypothetical protein
MSYLTLLLLVTLDDHGDSWLIGKSKTVSKDNYTYFPIITSTRKQPTLSSPYTIAVLQSIPSIGPYVGSRGIVLIFPIFSLFTENNLYSLRLSEFV